jgi:metal-responsive CopG/Arc/MetJ family transcriptional regulator
MGEMGSKRTEKIQVMLNDDEIKAIDDWRFENRLPSRAAAIRELLSRGLQSSEFGEPTENQPSRRFGVTTPPDEAEK